MRLAAMALSFGLRCMRGRTVVAGLLRAHYVPRGRAYRVVTWRVRGRHHAARCCAGAGRLFYHHARHIPGRCHCCLAG